MRWCWSRIRVQDFPQISTPKFHIRQRRKRTNITTKQTNRPKSGLTVTVNIGRLDKAINNLSINASSRDHEGQEYVSRIVAAGQQEEQSTSKVLHAKGTRRTKLTVTVYWWDVPTNMVYLCQHLCCWIEVQPVR